MAAPSQTKRHWMLAAMFVASAGLLLIGCNQDKMAIVGASSSAKGSVPVVSPTVIPLATATYFDIDSAKATYEAEYQQTRVARNTVLALTPIVPRPTWPPYQTPEPIDLPIGILPPNLGVHICDCLFENGWREVVNGEYILVYAGGYERPAEQGLVIVQTRSLNYLESSGWQFYAPPVQAGSLHITSADGLLLTLTAQNGQQFTFDIETRTWVSP